MSVYPSLPPRASLEDLFRHFPTGVAPLMQLHDELLRSDGPLSVGERELIAAYVSVLNACEYCFGAHRTMAIAFGVDPDLIDALVKDFDAAPVEPKMRALLSYAAKVTRRESILPSDMRAILDTGGTEEMAHITLMTASLYNLMNRVVDGAGLSAKLSYETPDSAELQRKRESNYTNWGRRAGFLPPA